MGVLYLCGACNPEGVRLALRVNRARQRWERVVLLDDDHARYDHSILGLEVAGPVSLLADADREHDEVANLFIRTAAKRATNRTHIAGFGLRFASLVCPEVDVLGASLPRDITIYPGASIGPHVEIGEGSVVLMGAVVGHGSRLGRCCVVGPNAVLNAGVRIEDGVYIGASATVLPERRIGGNATVAAGSVVTRNVAAGCTVTGVPARTLPALRDRMRVEARESDSTAH